MNVSKNCVAKAKRDQEQFKNYNFHCNLLKKEGGKVQI